MFQIYVQFFYIISKLWIRISYLILIHYYERKVLETSFCVIYDCFVYIYIYIYIYIYNIYIYISLGQYIPVSSDSIVNISWAYYSNWKCTLTFFFFSQATKVNPHDATLLCGALLPNPPLTSWEQLAVRPSSPNPTLLEIFATPWSSAPWDCPLFHGAKLQRVDWTLIPMTLMAAFSGLFFFFISCAISHFFFFSVSIQIY